MAKRWERAFGKQNLTFRIYERAKFKNSDLRKDFLSVLDCDIDEHRLNFNITKANESVKRIKAAALIACNKLVPLFGETGVNSLNHIFKSIILSSKSLDRFELIDIYKQNMFHTFMASNKALSKEFFGGEELFSRPQEDCETEDILSFAEVSNIVEEFTGEIISQTQHAYF